eukprot:2662027-Rhodomonas_salina.2
MPLPESYATDGEDGKTDAGTEVGTEGGREGGGGGISEGSVIKAITAHAKELERGTLIPLCPQLQQQQT